MIKASLICQRILGPCDSLVCPERESLFEEGRRALEMSVLEFGAGTCTAIIRATRMPVFPH